MPPKISGKSQKKKNSGAIPEKSYSENTKQATPSVLLGKRSATRREKSKADTKEAVAKRKPRVLSDQCDISSKVLDCHARGQLGSLTVAELKSFLTVKKAKVGGKKEDLVRRVALLLD